MADNIKKAAGRGGDKEEEPLIVAQRFLNIFHQLHVFDEEKRQVFNKMILEQPPQIKNVFRQLPGGSVLLEYIAEIEANENIQADDEPDESALEPVSADYNSKNSNTPATGASNKAGVLFDSAEFAKVLANTLAQSNAQIVKELNKNTQLLADKSSSLPQSGQVTLVTDDTFAQSIADALIKAISTSEQKHQEETKIIANSFLELQENLSKLIEQNAQLKIVSDGKISDEAVSAFQFKNIVDDLVKSQTKFLKETSQSQKEELSSIVSAAIKESIKLSTQSLADTFRQLYNEPAPITYASSEQKKQDMSEIENIIKAQGREFSSIIAAALRESQKNSTQSIIKTIEGLKPTSSDVSLQKADEIVKSQTKLLKDITREQNKEFSQLIANALKEGQKQSMQTIVELVKSLQNSSYVNNNMSFYPKNDFYPQVRESTVTENLEEETPAEQKKKKKKKKNKTNPESYLQQHNVPENFAEHNMPVIVSDVADFDFSQQSKPLSAAEDWGFSAVDEEPENVIETEDLNSPMEHEEQATIADDASFDDVDVSDDNDYVLESVQSDEISGEEGKDWEWDYEEVDENKETADDTDWADGEEGKDWEWDYEEVAEDEESLESDVLKKSQIVIPDDFKMLLIGLDPNKFEDPYCENVDDIY